MPFTPPKPIAPTPEDLRGSTVLVVDDERAWRVILETDLRMLGYKVSMAEDADQALEKAQSDQPEVAIIDLMLSSTPLIPFSRRERTTPTLWAT